MALVICAVLLIDRIRRRKSRGLFIESIASRADSADGGQNNEDDGTEPGSSPSLLELIDCCLHFGRQFVAERLFLPDSREQFGLSGCQKFR